MKATDWTLGGGAHPSAEELAAYLDSGLTRDDRARLSDHLVDCDVCRSEVIEASRLSATTSKRMKPSRLWLGAAAAAAVLVLLLLPGGPQPAVGPDMLRSSDEEARDVRTLSVVRPLSDSSVAAAGLVFVWNAVGVEASYRFTLADDAGSPLWMVPTLDTLVSLPDEIVLAPGNSYLWRVDALFSDGRTAASTVHRLTIVP